MAKKKKKKGSFKKKFLVFLLLVGILVGGTYLGFYAGSQNTDVKEELTEEEKENINYKKTTIEETIAWIDNQLSNNEGLSQYRSRLIEIKNMDMDADYNEMYKQILYLKDDVNYYLLDLEAEKEKAEEIDSNNNSNNTNETNNEASNENIISEETVNSTNNTDSFSANRALLYLINSNDDYKHYTVIESNGTYYFTENNNKIFAVVLWDIETSPITNLRYYAYNLKELNPETGQVLDSIEFGLIYENGTVSVE